jgi:hypothetical protein
MIDGARRLPGRNDIATHTERTAPRARALQSAHRRRRVSASPSSSPVPLLQVRGEKDGKFVETRGVIEFPEGPSAKTPSPIFALFELGIAIGRATRRME